MSDGIEQKIFKNYKKFKFSYVAVRSSAIVEDQDDVSFAGQHDSLLNIKGKKEIINAIKKCWASLFNVRAIQYRLATGFSLREISTSVIIQRW